MTDDRLRQAYQARAATRPTDSPPSPEDLARLVAGTGSEAERLALLDRVLADPATAREFALLRSIAAAERAEQPSRVRRWTAPLAVAATLAVVVSGTLWLTSRSTREAIRAPDESGVPTLATPDDSAARPAGDITFAWHSLPGATRYRIELLTEAGTVVATRQSADTATTVRVRPGGPYRWVVAALLPDGAERLSRPRIVRITP